MNFDVLNQKISEATGTLFKGRFSERIHGGCISETFKIEDGVRSFFVKSAPSSQASTLNGEWVSLCELANNGYVKTPKPITLINEHFSADLNFLVLEWLEFSNNSPLEGYRTLGENLANMHLHCRASEFGLKEHNTIGGTFQNNSPETNWSRFFLERRLIPQLDMAQARGGILKHRSGLEKRVESILKGHDVRPSLLHGDLWGGNAAICSDGTPVIFDPASYYGDPEADMAMTTLFGGFPNAFYAAYHDIRPRQPGWRIRHIIYNLYHILNHYNLFGGGYLTQAQQMADQII